MDSFKIAEKFPVPASVMYQSWLDSEIHSDFTGAMAAIEERPDSFFTAWDGYITGRILKLDKDGLIAMSWRTTEFPAEAESSTVELQITDLGDSCEINIYHYGIPEGDGDKYREGWKQFYLNPMRAYFALK